MTDMHKTNTFSSAPGFCSDCGSILPPLRDKGGVVCYTCSREFSADSFGKMQVKYTIHFNSSTASAVVNNDKEKSKSEEQEGPIVDRKCPNCGNETMSYATLQLRSADEGQTVFYTCTKCKFKESENS